MSAGLLGLLGLLQVRRLYLLLLTQLRFVSFASPVNSDGCATPLFLMLCGLSSGYRAVGAEPLLGYRAELASLGDATPLASLGGATPLR
jgi:hypothetical protein